MGRRWKDGRACGPTRWLRRDDLRPGASFAGWSDYFTRLRQKGNVLPILVLTARDEIDDRLLALDGGADDYVVKPVDSRELAARIRALSRRLSGGVSPSINLRGVAL